ncbi:MAG: hypothetical protein JNM88_17210 [Chitinophagaceae bacterium]|nr:hypothetical protein [Chitinophagaceae bacterium]
MKKFLIALLTCYVLQAPAQTETTIRQHYTEVNKQIAESVEQGFEGPLYQNQWIINKNGKSWPAVGIYADTVNFWYDDDPGHLPAAERNPKNVLLKINTSRHASALYSQAEFLFKDGRLLFYYLHEGEEGNDWQTRVYFNTKGVAFKTSVKYNDRELTAKELTTTEYKDFKPNPATILAESKKFQDLFLKTM